MVEPLDESLGVVQGVFFQEVGYQLRQRNGRKIPQVSQTIEVHAPFGLALRFKLND